MADCTDSHTMLEAVYLCNGAISEKTPHFLPPLPAEYVTVFSGQTDTPEVRFDLTDRQIDTLTDPTTVTLLHMCAKG